METKGIRTTISIFLKALLFTLLGMSAAFAQTIRIADNNANRPAGSNIYSTIQAAVDAAVAGDIVYVQPSVATYGDVTIDKQITLRGIGFNTEKDLAYTSTLGNINLTIKNDGTSNASGTTIEGIRAGQIHLGTLTGGFTYTLQNIIIRNCYLDLVYRTTGYQPAQNVTISQSWVNISFRIANVDKLLVYGNYFNGYNDCGSYSVVLFFGSGSLTNCIISNNVFGQYLHAGIYQSAVTGLAITNNIFMGGNNVSNAVFIRATGLCLATAHLYDALVTNNIFYGIAPVASSASLIYERNIFANNLSFGTTNNTLPPAGTGSGNTGSNNIVNQDPLFANAPYNTAYASTMDFRLQASSPARNAGSDGTDIGITGGAYSIASGNIALRPTSTPVMMSFNPAPLVPQNQPVKAGIKVKSN